MEIQTVKLFIVWSDLKVPERAFRRYSAIVCLSKLSKEHWNVGYYVGTNGC